MSNRASRADELTTLLEVTGCRVDRSSIQDAERLAVQLGASRAVLDVFTTGTLRPSGQAGPALEHVKGIVNRYENDPAFVRATIAAASSQDSAARPADYSAALLVLDSSRHSDALKYLASLGVSQVNDDRFKSSEVLVITLIDQLVVEGATDEVLKVLQALTRFGARVEESVTTPFKDRLPKLSVRWSPAAVERGDAAARELLGRELYDFLPAHDRRALVASLVLIDLGLPLPEIAPIVMPIGRVFEGFVGKVLLKLGIVTEVAVSDPQFTFMDAFDSKDAKVFRGRATTHGAMLDGLKQRLKEHRHIRAHSQASKWVQGSIEDAQRFLHRVVDDMKEYYKYFRDHFVS